MMKLNLEIDTSKTYILACSFGPDSMALLRTAIDNKINVIVAHVNYHKRDASNQEQIDLTEYCKNNNIKLEILDTTNLKAEGNFQEWARELRYKFFADLVSKYNAYGVLVAHHKDDLIETYLMQKKRGNIVKYWGIAKENELFGVRIIRPFLSYTKKELQEFDEQNNVPYSIDCSNLEDHYSRNKIRHEIVEKMSTFDKDKLIKEIDENNTKNFDVKTQFSLEEFLALSEIQITRILDAFMTASSEHTDLSKSYISEIKKAMSKKPVISFKISESVLLEKDYDSVVILNYKKIGDYFYKFMGKFANEFMEIDFTDGAEDRNIKNTDQMLILKNVSKKDLYQIGNYSCEVRRLFIDWKMPGYLRKVWPGIYDLDGKLLYVPRYRKDFEDNHKSKFTINTEYFSKF